MPAAPHPLASHLVNVQIQVVRIIAALVGAHAARSMAISVKFVMMFLRIGMARMRSLPHLLATTTTPQPPIINNMLREQR